ncbi:MAG: insulinase family protein [Polyangiaceae bacterium]|nr:insulinase family protein [Polyangiaceae bacterium]
MTAFGNSTTPLAVLRGVTSVVEGGLALVVVALPDCHRTVIEAECRIGSRYEAPEDNGLSHFLEHMLYRGTPTFPTALALAVAIEERGGALAAATSVDHGALTLTAPPETADDLIPILADVYTQPLLEGLEAEKGIVREEILETLDDDGRQIDADNLVRALSFGDHPLGRPITGTIAHVEGFDRTRLLKHHGAHYVAEGTVVSVAGPVDPDRMMARLAGAFAALPRGRRPVPTPPPEPDAPRFGYVQHSTSSQTSLRIAFRAPAETDPDEPAVEILGRLLDDGMSTRLYRRICDELGLCYDVFARYEAYEDAGLFELGADTAHENGAAVIEEMLAVVSELRDVGPTARELAKTKARFRWQLIEMADDPTAAAEYFCVEQLLGLGRTPADRWTAIEAVSLDRVQAVANRLFDRRRCAVIASGRLKRIAQDRILERLHRF